MADGGASGGAWLRRCCGRAPEGRSARESRRCFQVRARSKYRAGMGSPSGKFVREFQPEELAMTKRTISVKEIAEERRISLGRVLYLTRQPDFPMPVERTARERRWD